MDLDMLRGHPLVKIPKDLTERSEYKPGTCLDEFLKKLTLSLECHRPKNCQIHGGLQEDPPGEGTSRTYH